MKKLFTAICILATVACQAQAVVPAQQPAYPKDATTGLIDYTEAVPVEGVSKADLFTRAKLWLAGSFKSAKDVVQTEDKDAGIIVGKGYSPISLTFFGHAVPYQLHYTLKLNFKDGKYKYELTDLYFQNEPDAATSFKTYKIPVEDRILAAPSTSREGKTVAQMKAQYDATIPALLASLKAGMLKSSDF
jgi:hypothetical protein